MSEILHKDLIGEDIHELKVTVSAAPPASVPIFVGQGYYDLVAKKFYVAQGTSLLSDWITTDIPPFLTFLDTRTISWTSTTSGGGTQITYSANVEEAELILTSTNITDFSNAVLTLPEIVSLLADQHTRLILRTGGEPNPTVWSPAVFNGLELDSDSQKIKLSQNLSEIGDPTFNETTLTIRSRTPLLTLTSGGTPTAASLYLDGSKGMVARGFAGSTSSFTLQNEAGDDVLKNPVSTDQLVLPSLGGLDAPYVVHSDASGLLSASKLVDADVDAAAAIAGTKVSPDFGSQNITTTGSVLVDTIESNTNDIGILTGNDNKTILIGTGSGYNTINLGGTNTVVNISGAVYTTPVEYVTEDKNIVVNFNASGQDSPDSGLYVQEEYSGALINLTDATWQAGNTVRYAVDIAGIDGLVAGEYVRITGFVNTQNNGTFKVLTANAGYIDVVNPKRTDASKDETGVTANAARLLLNGYIHVGSTRMSWEVRAPAHAGIIELKPQTAAKTLQITSESSNDVTVKFNTNLTVDQDLQKTSSVEFSDAKISTFGTGIVHSNASGQLSSSLIQNADVDGSAAIAGTKISPDFGSQNITTTGDLSVSSVKVTGIEPVGGANFFTSATNGLVLRGVAGTSAQFKLISDLGVNFVTITDTSVTFHSLTNGVVKASSGTLSSSLLVNADVDAAANIEGSKIQAAGPTNAGVVDTATQSFSGNKTFNGNVSITNFSAAGVVHNNAAGLLSTSLIMNADVDPSAAISATKLSNQPSGNIAATTVQAAINELDTEKVAKSGDSMTGDLSFASNFGIQSTSASSVLDVGTNANTAVLNLGTGSFTNTINLGTGSGTTTINIGGPSDTVNITGTLNTVNVTDMEITDKNITLNKNGPAASGDGSGINIEEGSLITGFSKIGNSRTSWEFKAPASSGSVLLTPSAGAHVAEFKIPALSSSAIYTFPLTTDSIVGRNSTDDLSNKTLFNPKIDQITPYNVDQTITINGTAGLKIPSGTDAQRSAFTGQDGMVRYNTTNNFYEGHSAGSWAPLSGGRVVNISSTTTLSNETRYLTNTFAGPFSVTLPLGSLNSRIEIKDAVYTWQTNNLTIIPASGQRIESLAVNESLVCDINGGWVVLDWDNANSVWNLSTSALVDLNDTYATESYAGIVSTSNQTFAGTKKFNDGIILETNTTPAIAPSNGIQVYAKADNKLYTLNSLGVEQAVGSGGSVLSIAQSAHGFTSADVGRPLYLNTSLYAFAQANTEARAEVAALISRIVDADNFEICLGGEVSSVGSNLIVGGGSLTPGEMYFLSATDEGKISITPPSVVGQISKPVGIARTTTALDFFNMRGLPVGGTNAYSQITLTNNAVTTIQNASAYDSVELSGWVYINATVKYRFAIKVQVTKNGAGNNYLVSFQHSGDTPPTGFDIDATAAGLVQITLPSIAGFTSAVVQFSLNGPAVGASLPLQIESTNVSFSTVQAKDSTGIAFRNSSGTTIATLNNSGHLLLPKIPVFYAWRPGAAFATTTGAFGTIAPVFNTTRVNVDTCYNTTNGRFTAPVAGIYEFQFGITHRWSTGAGNLEPTFYVDGTNASPRGCAYSYVTAANDHDWVHTHIILSLNAGQYVQCGIHACAAGTDYYYGEQLGYFSGKLIG
jgi:hypothetical protein